MLEQAIIDAKALKEAALKNAETAIIEKYQDEVRTAVENLLEQEEDELGLGMEEPAEEEKKQEGGASRRKKKRTKQSKSKTKKTKRTKAKKSRARKIKKGANKNKA